MILRIRFTIFLVNILFSYAQCAGINYPQTRVVVVCVPLYVCRHDQRMNAVLNSVLNNACYLIDYG